jgi:hypothetical protein
VASTTTLAAAIMCSLMRRHGTTSCAALLGSMPYGRACLTCRSAITVAADGGEVFEVGVCRQFDLCNYSCHSHAPTRYAGIPFG